MIFVTVGTQLPFPRLIEAMDRFAAEQTEMVIAQTGESATSEHMVTEAMMGADRYNTLLCEARVVVAHAGVGSILAARQAGKPLVLLPRRAELREHRSDHQMATARQLIGERGVRVIWHERKLGAAIRDLGSETPDQGARRLGELQAEITRFVNAPHVGRAARQ